MLVKGTDPVLPGLVIDALLVGYPREADRGVQRDPNIWHQPVEQLVHFPPQQKQLRVHL